MTFRQLRFLLYSEYHRVPSTVSRCLAQITRKMSEKKRTSDIVDLYKDLAFIPSPTSARLQCKNGNLINIYSTWSMPDVIRAETTTFSREFVLDYKSKDFSLLSSSVPSDISSVSRHAFSKSGNRCAVLRKIKKNEEFIFLEIWNYTQKECTFDMNDVKEHGKIQDSGTFSSFEWSGDGKYLLYIADVKQKKSESFFKDLFRQKTDPKSSEEVTQGEEFLYRESWGEQNATAHHTVLCIFEISSGKVETLSLDDKYQNMSIAEATWGPNDEYIVFVGLEENPSRLGIQFCIRRSAIFSYNTKSKDVECLVTGENISARSPVFSPNFENFVFLQNESGGPHASTKKLMKYDWRTKEISIVIDIVENAHEDAFAGMYTEKLSSRWWSSNNRLFFFHTIQRCFQEIYCVDVFTSKLQRIDYGKGQYSCSVLDVKDPYIVVSASSVNKSPSLMIGYINNTNDEIQVSWSVVENSALELQDLHWKVDILTPSLQNETYPNLDYNIITIWSKEKKNGSLIIFPHGGPHSAFVVQYLVSSAAFAKLGFIVCLVNYRGSLGLGESSVRSLPGNAGFQDVADVVNAIEFLKKDPSLGIQTVFGFGGSHGGFLVAHLLGQYPTLLKAAIMRNPVIDLAALAATSDIPDWCWIESGCCETFDATKSVDLSILEKFYGKSPMKYMKDVVSPTLLQLGKADLRVPSSQGLQFYRHLKAQNVPAKVLYYDDNHSLAKVGVSSDAFVHSASWFLDYSAA